MNKLKTFLQERLNGLLLLFLATIIIVGISVSSNEVELKNELTHFSNENKALTQKEKVLKEGNNISGETDLDKNKVSLVTILGDDSKLYEVAVTSGISVIDLMDLLQKDGSQNFYYHISSGFVDKINEIGNQGNMSWMLYVCKNDVCKLSSVGVSDCKIDGWDRIEWRYLDWTVIDWATW